MTSMFLQEPFIRLLVEQLDDTTLANFRLCSSYCRTACDPIFFRRLTLQDCSDSDNNQTAHHHINVNLQRLLDPNDKLRNHVRHLEIGRFRQDSLISILNAEKIVLILRALTNLTDFGWNVCTAIPPEVLQTIHNDWPRCRIHTKQTDRIDATLDQDLIASTQLVSLQLFIYQAPLSQFPGSEWGRVTELLMEHKSLKSFRPLGKSYSLPAVIPDPVQLHLGPGAKLPELEDFAIPAAYTLDAQHCHFLVEAINWSSLRSLDVGHEPASLIQAITGRIPRLKSLAVYFRQTEADQNTSRVPNQAWISFFKSIDALEEISVTHALTNIDYGLWRMILQSQGRSLRKVKVKGKPLDEIDSMIAEAPNLEQLSLPIELIVISSKDQKSTYDWPYEIIEKLASLSDLRRLKLRVLVETESTISTSDRDGIHLQEDRARDVIISLARTFAERRRNSLEEVKVTFRTTVVEQTGHSKWTHIARLTRSGPPSITVQKRIFKPMTIGEAFFRYNPTFR